MAVLSLKNVRTMTADQPPRVLIYGTPGIGKTSLAAEFPAPFFLQLEDGAPAGVTMQGFGREELGTFTDVMSACQQLHEQEHDFRTIVVDSITELQRLIFAETCERGDEKGNAKQNIEDFGYGKGYVYAQRIAQEFIDGINLLRRDRGMGVVLIAHSHVERFNDPESVSYERYEIDLHKKLVGAIERDMDAILLLKKPVTIKTEEEGFNKTRARADGSADRVVIHTAGKPAFVAKNRYLMPATIEFKPGRGYAELAKFFPGASAPEPETVKAASRAARAA